MSRKYCLVFSLNVKRVAVDGVHAWFLLQAIDFSNWRSVTIYNDKYNATNIIICISILKFPRLLVKLAAAFFLNGAAWNKLNGEALGATSRTLPTNDDVIVQVYIAMDGEMYRGNIQLSRDTPWVHSLLFH